VDYLNYVDRRLHSVISQLQMEEYTVFQRFKCAFRKHDFIRVKGFFLGNFLKITSGQLINIDSIKLGREKNCPMFYLYEIDELIKAIDLSKQRERSRAILETLYGCGLRFLS
jgi:site-specific recombinase XerD